PFASCALGRLSQLSVWWLRLGIRPELIEPASPQQNGRHERMHRDLKAETTRPPAHSRSAQQRRFDTFRHTFNQVRPHEALDQRRPATLYTPSDRLYVPRLRPITYPEHFEIRRVSTNGGIRWSKRWVNVSHILATLPVGLEPLASGTWNVFFGPVHLSWLDEQTIGSTTTAAAPAANVTCHPSGEYTCHPSAEMFIARIIRQPSCM
ncbi:MAG: transposase, partial [Gemmatimonadales bacterium]|nr:transposase [Gemmatimonadales bacterium]